MIPVAADQLKSAAGPSLLKNTFANSCTPAPARFEPIVALVTWKRGGGHDV